MADGHEMIAVETKPAFEGYIENTHDALLVFEGQSSGSAAPAPLLITQARPRFSMQFRLSVKHPALTPPACRRGIAPRARNRLTDAERKAIVSGCVYVFSEQESRIKRSVSLWASACLKVGTDVGYCVLASRWTDGRRWSPSRILNNFLIYR